MTSSTAARSPAAAGFDPAEEIEAYGHRILSVHVKDRVLGGSTVPLGSGNADFEAVFAALGRVRYVGNYILQTARATDGDHAGGSGHAHLLEESSSIVHG